MSREHNVVVDVGTPSPYFCGWASTEIRFHGFADLPSGRYMGRYDYVKAPEFTCLGHRWTLIVYPGGSVYCAKSKRMTTVYLKHMSNENIKISFCFIAKCLRNVIRKQYTGEIFYPGRIEGSQKFAKYSKIMDNLIDGALVLDVLMRREEPAASTLTLAPFIPENPFRSNMLSLFLEEDSADIVFEVSQNSENEDTEGIITRASKKAKTTSSMFHAHRLILLKCAPQLAELCGTGGNLSPSIQITNVSPDIFRHLLYYVYGGKLSKEVMEANARGIIEAADRYGVTNLKLEAEASLVQSTTFSVNNVLGNLLFADSKNCALLKEAAMDFIVENSVEVTKKVLSVEHALPTMMTDLLAAMSRGKKKSGENSENDFSTIRISELRQKVHEKGLDVDGSRETLIAALEAEI